MVQPRFPFTGNGRSQWLADLAAALSNCDALIAALIEEGSHTGDVARLQLRVVAIRSEIEALQRGLPPAICEVDPSWLELIRPLYGALPGPGRSPEPS